MNTNPIVVLMKKIRLLYLILIVIVCSCNSEDKKKTSTTEQTPIENQMTKTNTATLEHKIKAALGEGAFWNYETQELYWIDIEGKTLHIYNPNTKTNKNISTPSRVGTVVPVNKEKAVIALQDGIYIINTDSGEIELISDIEHNIPTNRFNDGKCDPSGRLWVGSMALDETPKAANLYMVNAKGESILKKDGVTISNGIVWTKDKKTMYYIDTPTAEVKAYDYDDVTGNITNERVAIQVTNDLGYPDGMAIDENDNLWIGMWNGNAVIQFDPNSGKMMSKIEVPAHNVTSCAFGGENLDILYITTASVDMTDEELKKFPLAGSIFKVNPGVKGVKSPFYKFE